MHYRREIDGLRAFAILPVILFHAGFPQFSGGFVGVDVFFVISGYLITKIILSDIANGEFSLVNFYERRARRIFPVLFFVMAVSVPFAWMTLSKSDLISFSKSLAAVPLFVSNVFFWRDGGYFETASELKPLLHTWSLAVEEQYYIFFPFLLIFLSKKRRPWLIYTIVLVLIVSLLLAHFGSIAKPIPTFFLLPTRAWELATGALVAILIDGKSNKIVLTSGRCKELLSALGFILIIGSIFGFSKSVPSPSLYVLVPTVGAALVICYASQETLVGKLLGLKVFVSVGLISYSAYLWHQPIFAFARHKLITPDSVVMMSLSVFSLVLAFLSWRLIEKPFRSRLIVSGKSVLIASLLGGIFYITFGAISINALQGVESEERLAKNLATSVAVYSSNIDERKFVKSYISHHKSRPKVLVIGSSRLMQVGNHIAPHNFLNLSVSGASLEDYISILNMASYKFTTPLVMIGLDPWLFNSRSGQDRWRSIDVEYFDALRKIGVGDTVKGHSVSDKLAAENDSIVSSLGGSIFKRVNNETLIAIDDNPSVRDKIRKDGSRVYNFGYAEKTRSEIEIEFDALLKYGMHPYEFSVDSVELFERFIRHYGGGGGLYLFCLHITLSCMIE